MKLLSVLQETIEEQLGVGLWHLPGEPKTPIGRTEDNKPIYKKGSYGGGKEPLPDLDKLNDKSKACIDDVLSNPDFQGQWSEIGGFADRDIADSTTKSQHAYGNAIDWHGKTPEIMQKLADYFVTNATKLNVENVIYNYKIWNSPRGWHDYDTSGGKSPHTDHVHVDFTP